MFCSRDACVAWAHLRLVNLELGLNSHFSFPFVRVLLHLISRMSGGGGVTLFDFVTDGHSKDSLIVQLPIRSFLPSFALVQEDSIYVLVIFEICELFSEK